MIELRPEVQKFAEEMEKQLKANEHKGGWKDCTYDFLLSELDKNLNRLRYLNGHRGGCIAEIKESVKEVNRRCANIANFAMMICDNAGALGEDDDRREEGEHDD